VPYECQKQVVFFLIHRLPRFRAAAFDETGNGGYLAEVTALHFDTNIVERVSLNQSWYRE
jgi:phage FluMu gp28-like protein